MAGRTDRVNARELMDRADGIFFEGEVARDWLAQLERRMKGALEGAKGNRIFEREWRPEYQEMNDALSALKRACDELEVFVAAVAKREGKTH